MENRDIVNKVNNCTVDGVKNIYIGYIIDYRIFKKHRYKIQTPFICLISTPTFFNVNPKSDYLYINVFSTLDELLSIDVSIIKNPSLIFIPVNNTDIKVIVDDIKQKHPKHGFNEEPFYNSL
jgi:hypothetical protein